MNPRGHGTKKQGVIGVISRKTGEVRAKTQDKFTFVVLKAFLEKRVNFSKATLYTDDFTAYKPFKQIMKHARANHSHGEYVSAGNIHTNTIEGFWGIFKRSIVGSYHTLSVKHLDKYIQERYFKCNNRNNTNIFETLLINSVK